MSCHAAWIVCGIVYLMIQGLYSLSGRTSYRKISRSLETASLCYNDRIALKFDRHLDSTAAEMPVKFQSVWKSLNMNLRDFTRSRRKTSVRLVNRGPVFISLSIIPLLTNDQQMFFPTSVELFFFFSSFFINMSTHHGLYFTQP